eukprot:CAMPEP_0176012786 /NCGR_PEP_ID=MMETSP0120_2-20121206/5975_1 /TAXON_ID=160619 /ORGANISM="Kryptoperidinium foliaceum, Strain CCMP 1326" /LENGTH=1113 /DNA_ID=CAMNT_0017345683 /DNA_START=137 /DNA_END=3475 /DNA_ORIENTATION=-
MATSQNTVGTNAASSGSQHMSSKVGTASISLGARSKLSKTGQVQHRHNNLECAGPDAKAGADIVPLVVQSKASKAEDAGVETAPASIFARPSKAGLGIVPEAMEPEQQGVAAHIQMGARLNSAVTNSSRKKIKLKQVDPALLNLDNAPKKYRKAFEVAMQCQCAVKLVSCRPWELTVREVEEFCDILGGPVAGRIYIDRLDAFMELEQVPWSTRERIVLQRSIEDQFARCPHDCKKTTRCATGSCDAFGCKDVDSSGSQLNFEFVPPTFGYCLSPGDPRDTLLKSCTYKHLHHALTSGEVRQQLQMRDPEIRDKYYWAQYRQAEDLERKEQIEETQVLRKDMRTFLERNAKRNDAFVTLPMTLLFVVVFMSSVSEHLRIFTSSYVERGLEEWINGRDPNATATHSVQDIRTLWTWMRDVGVPGVLEDPIVDAEGFTRYRLASRNFLVGDIELHIQYLPESNRRDDNFWLLHTNVAKTYLKENPTQYLEAALASLEDLRRSPVGSSPFISEVYFRIITFNEDIGGFAHSAVQTSFDRFGHVKVVVYSSAIYTSLYDAWLPYIIDLCYGVLTVWVGVKEFFDLFIQSTSGLDGFRTYWNIWNLVDWLNISASALVAFSWVVLWNSIKSSNLRQLVGDDSMLIKPDLMVLSEHNMHELKDDIYFITRVISGLKVISATTYLTLVFRFFKAFESNLRLKVITDTLRNATTDLAHFFIVFTGVFTPFAISSHILFGQDFEEHASLTSAMQNGIKLILRDFEWYADTAPVVLGAVLPSGMPQFVLFTWFVVFQVFMVVIILNMLLGIIFEHYTRIAQNLALYPDAPEVWKQVDLYLRFARQTLRFISLDKLLIGLQSDQVNPDEQVSVESLSQSFEKMKPEQAHWLMEFLRNQVFRHKQSQEKRDASLVDESQIFEDTKAVHEEVFELARTIFEHSSDSEIKFVMNATIKILRKARKDGKALTKSLNALDQFVDIGLAKAPRHHTNVDIHEGDGSYQPPKASEVPRRPTIVVAPHEDEPLHPAKASMAQASSRPQKRPHSTKAATSSFVAVRMTGGSAVPRHKDTVRTSPASAPAKSKSSHASARTRHSEVADAGAGARGAARSTSSRRPKPSTVSSAA